MFQACAEFLELAQAQEKLWQKALQHERQQRMNLEETVEALAKQHNTLERACSKNTGVHPVGIAGLGPAVDNDSDEEEDEDEENAEFFDAISENPEECSLPASKSRESLHSRTSSDQSFTSEDGSSLNSSLSRKDSNKSNEDELSTGVASISETFRRGTFGNITSVSIIGKFLVYWRYCQVHARAFSLTVGVVVVKLPRQSIQSFLLEMVN